METNLKYINLICTDLGGVGGHFTNLAGENEICTLLGGTGGHFTEIAALNEICTIQGVTAGHSLNLAALSAIGATAYRTNLEGWKNIQEGTQLNYCNEYKTILEALPVTPSKADQIIQNAWVKGMVSLGVWDKAVLLNMWAMDSAANSLINLKSPGTFNPTKVSTPAWEAYKGYTGYFLDPVYKYIDLNFNPSLNTDKVGQDNICAIIGVGTDVNETASDFGALNLFIIARNGTQAGFRCNSGTSKVITNTSSIKHIGISRGNSANYDVYLNTTKTNITDASTVLPNVSLVALGRQGSVMSTKQQRYCFLFSYLTEAEVTGVINLTEAYLDNYNTGLFFLVENDFLTTDEGQLLTTPEGAYLIK